MAEPEDKDFEQTMILPPGARAGAGERQPPPARLLCLNDADLPDASCRSIPLGGEGLTIGRSPECTYTLDAHGVSRNHAEVFSGGDIWGVRDLGSTNGVLVNGSRVHETWLKHGDTLELGKVRYRYLEEDKDLPGAAGTAADDGERTVVMGSVDSSPTASGAVTQPMDAPRPEAVAAARKRHQGDAERPHRPRVAEESGSNVFLWILGGLVLVLVLATASFFI